MNFLNVNVKGFTVMQLKEAGHALSTAKCAFEERELLSLIRCTLSNTAADNGTGFTLTVIEL